MSRSVGDYILFCPACGQRLGSPARGDWLSHLLKCGVAIDVRMKGGGWHCACGSSYRLGYKFSEHIRFVDHDWQKLAVTNFMEGL